MSDPIVIIGAGQAGIACAAKLRALGYVGAIVMIGDEPTLPYQRPPLSKKYAAGELSVDRLLIRPTSWYAEQDIDIRLQEAVRTVSPGDKTVTLASGSQLRYQKLLLATGSRPRRLPSDRGGALHNVITMRNLADADALRPLLVAGRRLLVIGGGYIGLEAAAVARSCGLAVTVLEMADRILQRVAAPLTSDYFRTLHAGHGVTIRERTSLEKLTERDGRVTGATFSDGKAIDVDLAIVGIGIVPNDDLARQAGLRIENGIMVNGRCQTSAPDIFAAGDCASFMWHGTLTRLESVQNAIDQAEHAAAAMLGESKDYAPLPWFWSDQYDVKLQIAGLNHGYDDAVLRPGKRDGSQSVWYFRGDQLLAVDAMNDALAYGLGKKTLELAKPASRSLIGDPTVDLKTALS